MFHVKHFLFFLIILALFSCASAEKASFSFESSSYELFDEANLGVSRLENNNNNRMITYSVSLELLVKKPEETRDSLFSLVNNHNGFIVQESNNYIRARIPAQFMSVFLSEVKALGKTDSESISGTDITDQYRDNLIRLNNLKSVRDRYITLLERADTVIDILNIERELERVNTDIEIMEGRIKYAEQSVTYSNITIRYREQVKPGIVGWVFYGLFVGIKWLFVW